MTKQTGLFMLPRYPAPDADGVSGVSRGTDYFGHWYDSYQAETAGFNASGQVTAQAWSAGSVQYIYSATQNNGQITQMVDALSGKTASYQYDGFGNLTAKVLNGTTTSIAVNGATNRLTNAGYDANRNMTSGADGTFSYDEANRMTSAQEVSGGIEYFGYAADNKRILRVKTDGTEERTFHGGQGEKLGVFQSKITELLDGSNQWVGDTIALNPLWSDIADVILNRFLIVNGYDSIVYNGSIWGAAGPGREGFGWANGSIAGIVGYSRQFATFATTTADQTTAQLSPFAKSQLDASLAMGYSSAQCANLASSFFSAFDALQEAVLNGGKLFGTASFIPTSFNSLETPKKSLLFEGDTSVSFGTANRFYGISPDMIEANSSPKITHSPIRAPRPAQPPRPPRGR